jgi:hypothetical protein
MERTIQDGKKYLRQNFEKGVICPCCGQFVKRYKRKLNSGMAKVLIDLYRHGKTKEVNVKGFLRENRYKNNHDWTLLRYWGLIKSHNNEEEKDSGVWSITERGLDFILCRLSVPKYVLIFNSKMIGLEGDSSSIIDALGRHFNYKELMSQ